MLVKLKPHESNMKPYIKGLKNPTVYVVQYKVLKRVKLKKDGGLKMNQISPVEQNLYVFDEVPRIGWKIKEDAELEEASIWRNKITTTIKIVVTNPEGMKVYVDADSVIKLFLKGLHISDFNMTKMFVNECSQLINPDFEEDLND
jgi:hypothetical protein